ncbi:hypothetical protein GCM10020221_27890 [Streptomyces thioluteus]|uniref:Uncharacterized protein n=1 Tax=Streptomyces thioluteus TaxID=66431 RepID=A0ABP6JH95_STRTU
MRSREAGISTTIRPKEPSFQAESTAGTAVSASPATDRSRSVCCPAPRTRLRAPRTTVTRPCSHNCRSPDAVSSPATYHRPSRRTAVSRTGTATGAASYPARR